MQMTQSLWRKLRRQLKPYYIALKKSHNYALKLNQNKCIHIQMNAVRRIHFRQGNAAPVQTQADYLGGKIKNTGDHKPELQHRITATWATVRRLDLLRMGKTQGKHEMEIESLRRSNSGKTYVWVDIYTTIESRCKQIGRIPNEKSEENISFKKNKHPYWSRIPNNKSLEIANDKLKNEQDKSCLERLSKRPIEGQIALFAHTIRLDEQDPLKRISVDEAGGRVRSYFRRTDRPRTTWYDTTRNHTIKKLIKEGHLPRNVREINTKQELNEFIIQMAQDRHI